jgi:ribosomal protein L29
MDIEAIIKENQELNALVTELQEKLRKYTNPDRNKKYYENNKEMFIETSNKRLEQLKETNPDKLKEYRRNAYLKRKEKLKNENIKENT